MPLNCEYIPIRLHILSPVHIGCGEVYEPTNFYIDERNSRLVSFNTMSFIKSLDNDKLRRFSELCENVNLLEIYKFIASNALRLDGRSVSVGEELKKHYLNIMSMPTFRKDEVINRFTLARTAFNPHDNMPYIPGSSLKGALKTAYFNRLAQNKPQGSLKTTKDVESLLGGSFHTDPFSCVKISDLAPAGDVATRIVYAVNRKKRPSDKSTLADKGPYQIFEIIMPGAIFEGEIKIDVPLTERGVQGIITKDSLMQTVKKFFLGCLAYDKDMLTRVGLTIDKIVRRVNGIFMDNPKNGYLVRIGRHSGAEAVTVEKHRKIKIMHGGSRPATNGESATTVWLASDHPRPNTNTGLYPFGWAALEIIQT